MLYWFKQLPETKREGDGWEPFINTPWLNKNYNKLFKACMLIWIIALSLYAGTYYQSIRDNYTIIIIAAISVALAFAVLAVHEALHILVVYRYGDVSLTRVKGYWGMVGVDSAAELSKLHYLIFALLPTLLLTVCPLIISLFTTGFASYFLGFAALSNISPVDIINSIVVIRKPRGTVILSGYYKVE